MFLSPATAASVQNLGAEAFQVLWADLRSEAERRAVLHARCRTDLGLFARTFFPERFELDWSPVHEEFLTTETPSWRKRATPVKRARVSPRGSAKSSIKSFLQPIHDVVYGLEVCIHLYSTGYRLAETLVKDIYDVLSRPETAPLLHQVFSITTRGSATNFVVQVKGAEPLGTAITAMSFGGDARGYKHAGKRPSKFILDDTVNPKHIKNPEQRDAQWKFLQSDIGKAGWTYSITELVGTIQHPDDLVARVVASPGWRSRRWCNMISWPTATDLWDQCKELWAKLEDPNRVSTARGFYEANREAMSAGAEVLWPEGRGLFDLMTAFWEAPASFWAEDQNDPRDPALCIFVPEKFRRCSWDGRELVRFHASGREAERIPLRDLEIAIWHDRAKGGKKGDFPATAVLARTRSGYIAVLEVVMEKEPTSGQRARIWRLWEKYLIAKRVVVAADDTAQTEIFAGESWERERSSRREAGRPWNLQVESHTLSDDKEARIRSIEPDCLNGWLLFAQGLPPEVFNQFRDFPAATHDDAPDAIERARALLARDSDLTFHRSSRG